TGSGQLTLSGLNTCSGNTTVDSGGTLGLADDAGMTFAVTATSANKVTGGGAATFDGDFTIDTSAVTAAVGSWTLVDVATPVYGPTFSLVDFTGAAGVWTKVDGASTWTFTEATGVLSVVSEGVFTSFGISGSSGLINNSTLTIKLFVPSGTDLAALAPEFTLSSGTCDTASGTAPDPTFAAQNPATYTVTAGATVNAYTVTVIVSDMVLDGLVVWLKADAVEAGDPAQVDGTTLLQWNDSSGNGNNAANANAGDRPEYVAAALNGLPVIRFAQDNDDNGDRLFLGDLSASFPTAGSMFAVTTPNNDGRYNIFDNRTNDSRWVANTWTESQVGAFRGGRTNFGTNPYSSWPQSGAHVYALESSSSAYTVVIDGTQIGTTGGDYNNGAGQDWVIANRPGGGQPLNGDIAEFVLFDRILSPEEASQVGQYLANKYGLSTAYNPQPALITTFEALGIEGVIDQGATTIALEVPLGTDLAALAPTFTLSSGTCDQTSGSPPIPDDFSVQNPVTYTVTDGATVNVYTVTVTIALPPVNDNFADAIDLPGNSGTQTGTGNVRATTETGEPGINGANNTVWFTWTAPSNGEFTVMTNGSTNLGGGEWDAMLGMYTGTSVDALTALPGTPLDTGLEETMTVTVTAGTTYAIQAAGYANDVAANILLTWSFVSSGNDYDDWVASSGFAEGDDTTPTGDPDGDGLNNDQERAFGLDPTSGSSVNPITVPLDAGAGTFSYTRRNPALSGLTYTVWTSTDLATWTEDAGADQNDGGATTDVQTVAVTLTPGLLSTPELFVRVQAAE
ncbi:MAG: hypothetical protein K9N23_13875, partial [Akkermansiaceae bacterium]|nr:hypothetical protein [Akkermansiaceae bacterium]